MTTLAPPQPKAYDDDFFRPITLWLTTTDHKLIGIILALLMRIQLAQPNLKVMDAETYNEVVSAHGTMMIFFFVTVFRPTSS